MNRFSPLKLINIFFTVLMHVHSILCVLIKSSNMQSILPGEVQRMRASDFRICWKLVFQLVSYSFKFSGFGAKLNFRVLSVPPLT